MQKTRFGITVGLLGAALYFLSLFNGYLLPTLLAAYILLFEENLWLKKTAVKSVALLVTFSLLSALVYLLPDTINFIHYVVWLFDGHFSIDIVDKLVNIISAGLSLLKTVLFIGLGLKALNQSSITVPVVDKLIEKYMG